MRVMLAALAVLHIASTAVAQNGAYDPQTPRLGGKACYFDECDTNDTQPPQQQPPQQQPPQQQPPQQAFSMICQTPAFWCAMYQAGYVGYSCFCSTGFGYVNG